MEILIRKEAYEMIAKHYPEKIQNFGYIPSLEKEVTENRETISNEKETLTQKTLEIM